MSATNGNGGLQRLRNVDYSDRELLLRLRDVADDEGYATAKDVAAAIGLQVDNPHRFVASRFGHLSRVGEDGEPGAVAREFLYDHRGNPIITKSGKHRHSQRWKLTPIGEAMAAGKLKAAERRAFEGLSDAQLLVASRVLTQRVRDAGSTARALAKREWRYGTAPERALNGSREMPL